MLLLTTQTPITNPNAPIYERDPDAEAILALGPSLWLEADTRFVVTDGANVKSWVDRVSGRRYVPALADKPTLVASGSKSALRMDGPTGSALIPEGGFDTFTATGTHTMVVLMKMPAPSSDGFTTTGGQVLGTNAAGAPRDITHNYQIFVTGSGGIDVASGGQAINGSGAPDRRNGQWRLVVVSCSAENASSDLRENGVSVQVYAGAKPPPIETARQLIIGATGLTADAQPWRGYIGGVMYIPGRALTGSQLATLENYWMQRRADRA